jgi:hypothetical protein
MILNRSERHALWLEYSAARDKLQGPTSETYPGMVLTYWLSPAQRTRRKKVYTKQAEIVGKR